MSELKDEAEDVLEYKFWPKPDGLEKVFRHLGLGQAITPLEALLAALPAVARDQVRALLAAALPAGDRPPGGGGRASNASGAIGPSSASL